MRAENQPGSNEDVWRHHWRRRPTSAALVSMAAHVVLGVLVWYAVKMPAVFDEFMQRDAKSRPVAEKVEFVSIRPLVDTVTAAPRAPRAPRRSSAPAPAGPATVPLVAPTEVPTTVPPPPVVADTAPHVTGPLRGGYGPTKGVQPNYDDPRVWTSDATFYYAPKTAEEKLDSAVLAGLMQHMDSMAANAYTPNKFERGDWTVGSGNSKWGVDQQYIHIGRFRIPTAILALLPTPYMQANPIAMDRDRNASYMRQDIMYHAQAQMNEDQFRKAVRDIRDRKEREKRTITRVSPNSPGPLTSPGERPPPR